MTDNTDGQLTDSDHRDLDSEADGQLTDSDHRDLDSEADGQGHRWTGD